MPLLVRTRCSCACVLAARACSIMLHQPQNKKKFRIIMRNLRCEGVCPGYGRDFSKIPDQQHEARQPAPQRPHVRYCQRAKPAGCRPQPTGVRHCAPRPAPRNTARINVYYNDATCCQLHRWLFVYGNGAHLRTYPASGCARYATSVTNGQPQRRAPTENSEQYRLIPEYSAWDQPAHR